MSDNKEKKGREGAKGELGVGERKMIIKSV